MMFTSLAAASYLMRYCSLPGVHQYTFAITMPDFLQNGQSFYHIIDRVYACHVIQRLVEKLLLKNFALYFPDKFMLQVSDKGHLLPLCQL